jgi:hypothetical protein
MQCPTRSSPEPETSRPAAYEIRVRGHLGSAWSDWFTGLRVTLDDNGDTLLVGPLDQAALHGVLRRVRDLGMPLISVTRIESGRLVPQAPIKKQGRASDHYLGGRGLFGPPNDRREEREHEPNDRHNDGEAGHER